MCGRYVLKEPLDLLQRMFRYSSSEIRQLPARYNIAPTTKIPVVRCNKQGEWRSRKKPGVHLKTMDLLLRIVPNSELPLTPGADMHCFNLPEQPPGHVNSLKAKDEFGLRQF